MRMRYDVQGNVTEISGPGPERFRVTRNSFSITHFEGRLRHTIAHRALRCARPASAHRGSERRWHFYRDILRSHPRRAYRGRFATTQAASPPATRYAGASEPIVISQRDAGARTYYRDAAGRMRERINADGSTLFYSYDVIGRLTRIEAQPAGGGARQTRSRDLLRHRSVPALGWPLPRRSNRCRARKRQRDPLLVQPRGQARARRGDSRGRHARHRPRVRPAGPHDGYRLSRTAGALRTTSASAAS